MTRFPHLESFDLPDKLPDPTVIAEPTAEWRAGHAAGLAQGQAIAAAVQSDLTAEMAQCFADMGFGFAEARLQLLSGLKPLFGAIINRVLPGLSQSALAAQVVDLLYRAAAQDSRVPLELLVNPDRIDGLTSLLPYAVGMPVILVADPSVGLDQAVLRASQSETLLDVGTVLAGVQAALEAIFETTDERTNYG